MLVFVFAILLFFFGTVSPAIISYVDQTTTLPEISGEIMIYSADYNEEWVLSFQDGTIGLSDDSSDSSKVFTVTAYDDGTFSFLAANNQEQGMGISSAMGEECLSFGQLNGSTAEKWTFIYSAKQSAFYIKNSSSGTFLTIIESEAGDSLALTESLVDASTWLLKPVELQNISSWEFNKVNYTPELNASLVCPGVVTAGDATLFIDDDFRLLVSYEDVDKKQEAFVIEGIGCYTGTATIYAEPVFLADGAVVTVREAETGKLVALDKQSVSRGAGIYLETACDKPRQVFTFKSDGNGNYYIENYLTKKVLDVSGASYEEGAQVVEWDFNGADNQKWRIVRADNGYKLQSVFCGLYLGFAGEGESGATCVNSSDSAQIFLFDEVPASRLSVYDTAPSVLRVLEKCYQVGWPGPNWCAYWVEEVFYAAGWGYHYGDANTLYYRCCYSNNLNDLEVGMIVATAKTASAMGQLYGHVGIYIGDGWVMDSGPYGIRTISFSEWCATYGQLSPVYWGWISG